MNKYTEMVTLKNLAAAEVIIKKLSAQGKYLDIMTMVEFVTLHIAIMDARKLIEDDLLSRIEN